MSHQPLSISQEALFRYQWVSEIEARVQNGERVKDAITAVRHHPRTDWRGEWRRPSERSLYRWRSAYRKAGIAGLEPASREKIEDSRVLSPDFLRLLREAKSDDPELSVPELIERGRHLGVLGATELVSRSSVWRACRRMGLPLDRRQALETSDTRRFSYPHRMMMVLSDGKYFRAGVKRRKRVALCFLDDSTRFVLGALVGTTETTMLFLEGLYEVLLRYGLMLTLYLDRGPGFISNDTEAVLARLGRRLILGQAGYPEGHGKIERFNRTLKQKVLRGLDGNPEVDPDCGSLTLRLRQWLFERYNHTPHEALDGKTPAERFHNDQRDLDLPSDRAFIDAQFVTTLERRTSADHVVSINGTLYEVPSACHGRIAITHHLRFDRYTVRLDGTDVEIHPLDPIRNAFDRRARKRKKNNETQTPRTTAQKAFDDYYGPIVDVHGGYPHKEDE